MALKSTVHKALVQLSDMDRHIYQSLSLTLAQHPSENDQRMMCRLVAFYCYGQGDADNWWQKISSKLSRFDNLTVYRIPSDVLETLSGLASKTMTLQCSIDQGEMWLSDASSSIQLNLETLYSGN